MPFFIGTGVGVETPQDDEKQGKDGEVLYKNISSQLKWDKNLALSSESVS